MNFIQSLIDLFVFSVTNVLSGISYLCMLLVAAWGAALIFNLIDAFLDRGLTR